jgi:hypothetical protein
MSVTKEKDCLTFRSNELSGHLLAAAVMFGGVFLFWFGLRESEIWIRIGAAIVALILIVIGASKLFSRPNVVCFDRATGQLSVRGGTFLSRTEACYPLSDIKAVKLVLGLWNQVKLITLPSNGQDDKARELDVVWGFGSDSEWRAKAKLVAAFLGVEFKVEVESYEAYHQP